MTGDHSGLPGRPVYLDYNATTPVDPRVLEALLPGFRENFGNPSSDHAFGAAPKVALRLAREQVAAFVGSTPQEIIFTGSGSEADALAIRGRRPVRDGRRPGQGARDHAGHRAPRGPRGVPGTARSARRKGHLPAGRRSRSSRPRRCRGGHHLSDGPVGAPRRAAGAAQPPRRRLHLRTAQPAHAAGRQTVTAQLPREQWVSFIPGAHPGYITLDQFDANLARLHSNAAAHGLERRSGPPREGSALLQGIIVCGRCGLKMTVRYHHRRGTEVPTYMCQRDGIENGRPVCATIPDLERPEHPAA